MTTPPPSQRLVDLVEHAEYLDAAVHLSAAQSHFARAQRRFLGVVSGNLFVGVASAREITELLSAQFGHALFGRSGIGSHVMRQALAVAPDVPLTELLRLIAQRDASAFDDDVALVSEEQEFLGLIPMHRLVRLQTALLLDNLAEVERQRGELAERNRRMLADLHMARQVQLALVAGPSTTQQCGTRHVSTTHVYEPAEELGGDFFAVLTPRPGVMTCFVSDVMGHGVRPALITGILRALVSAAQPDAMDPGAILTRINTHLIGFLGNVGELIFVTAGCAVIDLHSGRLLYAQAGHPRPILWRGQERRARELELSEEAAGAALGVFEDGRYETVSVPFGCGDALLMFTDGMSEAAPGEGEEFGVERLCETFESALVLGCDDIPAEIVKAVRAHAGAGNTLADDVCAIVVRCTERSDDRETPGAGSHVEAVSTPRF